MRSAETVLGILRERGRRGLPLERVYRWVFNPDRYLLAYGKIARNRGISLRWRIDAVLDDRPPHARNARTDVLERPLADTCELCGSHDRVQVHHVRHLKDLQQHPGKPVPAWVRKMAARHRKTLVACHACHVAIHAGRPAGVRIAA